VSPGKPNGVSVLICQYTLLAGGVYILRGETR
jgi:hypothetical protein